MKNFVDDVNANRLLEKSRAYMQRAYTCEDQGDHDGYLIWSSLSLELLGKSALASLNPVLILETKDVNSALASIGDRPSTMIRTIGAREVYSRISAVCPSFTPDLKEFCQKVADHRNVELHSAGQPFARPPESRWTRAFWHSVDCFLKVSKISIEQWLGIYIAERGRIDQRKLREAELNAALSKMDFWRDLFSKRTKKQNQLMEERALAFTENDAVDKLEEISGYLHDHILNEQQCPICNHTGWTGSTCIKEEVNFERHDKNGEYCRDVDYVYEVNSFYCPKCELTVDTSGLFEASELERHYGWCDTEYPEDPRLAAMKEQDLLDMMPEWMIPEDTMPQD